MTYPFDPAQLIPPGRVSFPEPDAYEEKIAVRQLQADIAAGQPNTHIAALTTQYPLEAYTYEAGVGRAVFNVTTMQLIAADLGAAVAGYFGTYPYWPDSTVAAAIYRLVTGYGTAGYRFTDDDIDLDNFAAFDAAHPQAVGLSLPARENVLVACQMLAASVGAQLAMSPLGKLRLLKVALPPVGPIVEIHPYDMVDESLEPADLTPVSAAVTLGYCKNWTPQTGLLTAIPDESKTLFEKEWLTTTKEVAGVAAAYRSDTAPEQQDTMLLRKTDADPEAQRRADLWSKPRLPLACELFPWMQKLQLGDAVRIFHWRFDAQDGRLGQIVRREPALNNGRIKVQVLV